MKSQAQSHLKTNESPTRVLQIFSHYKPKIGHIHKQPMADDFHINLQEQRNSDNFKRDPRFSIEPDQLQSEDQMDQMRNRNNTEQKGNEAAQGCCGRICNFAYLEQFFRVTEVEVLERIKMGFLPFKSTFLESVNGNADFYGPFWLLTTIVFLTSSTSNLSRYFYNWTKDQYIFKLELLRIGVLVTYSFGFGVPALLFLIMKVQGIDKYSLAETICLYGYSLSCLVPILLLCIIPVQAVQWILIAYGMINTSAFLILNIRAGLEELQLRKVLIIAGFIGMVQIGLFLTLKLVFFKLVYEEVQS